MSEEQAARFISDDARVRYVLFPFLGGQDLNSSPALGASRWIVDFTAVSDDGVKSFGAAFSWVRERVKPARALLKQKPKLQSMWWRYESSSLGLRKAIADLDEVLVIALVSNTVMPMRVRTGQVFSHKLAVFATHNHVDQAVLSSSLHQVWAMRYGSTMRRDVNYSPSDVFLTFPRPEPTGDLERLGKVLDEERREMMLRRGLGLTRLYNLVNDRDITDASDADIARLRQIHVDLDHAVMAAYGWSGVRLDHGFHTYRRMQRWTVSPAARVEILDRLLEENHRRAALQGGAPPAADADDTADGTEAGEG
jgi:hypothetical protein